MMGGSVCNTHCRQLDVFGIRRFRRANLKLDTIFKKSCKINIG